MDIKYNGNDAIPPKMNREKANYISSDFHSNVQQEKKRICFAAVWSFIGAHTSHFLFIGQTAATYQLISVTAHLQYNSKCTRYLF